MRKSLKMLMLVSIMTVLVRSALLRQNRRDMNRLGYLDTHHLLFLAEKILK